MRLVHPKAVSGAWPPSRWRKGSYPSGNRPPQKRWRAGGTASWAGGSVLCVMFKTVVNVDMIPPLLQVWVSSYDHNDHHHDSCNDRTWIYVLVRVS
jgi:hypothetical protein